MVTRVSPWRGQKLYSSLAVKGKDMVSCLRSCCRCITSPLALTFFFLKPSEELEEQETNCIKSALEEGVTMEMESWVGIFFRLLERSGSFSNKLVWS